MDILRLGCRAEIFNRRSVAKMPHLRRYARSISLLDPPAWDALRTASAARGLLSMRASCFMYSSSSHKGQPDTIVRAPLHPNSDAMPLHNQYAESSCLFSTRHMTGVQIAFLQIAQEE